MRSSKLISNDLYLMEIKFMNEAYFGQENRGNFHILSI